MGIQASLANLIKIVLEQQNVLLKLLKETEREADEPVLEPPPSRPKPPPPNETYQQMLLRRHREDVAAGRAIDMRAMGLSIPKPKPPRKPSWDR